LRARRRVAQVTGNEADLTSVTGGDAAAITALAKRHLAGDGVSRDPEMAARLLAAADEKGDGEAAALIAVLVGVSANSAEIWAHAFGYLQRAAELGFAPARGQLAVLSDDPVAVAEAASVHAPPDIWKRLRQSIDLRAWLSPPDPVVLSERPVIRTYPHFIAPAICDWLIDRVRGRIARAQVFDAQTGHARPDPARTNSAFEFKIGDADLVLLLVRARLAKATGFLAEALEDTNVLHYHPGQEFHPHFDFLDIAKPGMAQEIAAHGQRVASFLIYLNDGFESGETDFPLLKIRSKPARGGALFFRSVNGDGTPDRTTVHAGLPPASGEKWLFSQWIRTRFPA
jgi:hypothetical protein